MASSTSRTASPSRADTIASSSRVRLQSFSLSSHASLGQPSKRDTHRGVPRRSEGEEETSSSKASSDEETSNLATKKILSLTVQGKNIGAACFDQVTRKLLLLEDAPYGGTQLGCEEQFVQDRVQVDVMNFDENPHSEATQRESEEGSKAHDVVIRLLEQMRPDLVLINTKCLVSIIESVKKELAFRDATVQIRPGREYDFEAGKKHLAAALSVTEDTRTLRHGLLRVLSAIDLDELRLSTACASALLHSLTRLSAVSDLRYDADLDDYRLSSVDISAIESIRLDHCMGINSPSRIALSISPTSGGQEQRQSRKITLFALLGNLRTPLSRTLLARWFQFPSTNLQTIAFRHDAVSCLLAPANSPVMGAVETHLKGMKNVPRLLHRLQRGSSELSTWRGLSNFCLRALNIRACVLELQSCRGVPIFAQILEEFDPPQLSEVADFIESTIDWEGSSAEGRICVKSGVDAQLDEWKDLYAGLPSLLSKIALALKGNVDIAHAAQMNVAYFPQLGYLIAIAFTDEITNYRQMQVSPLWQFHFASEVAAYWKSPEMIDLDQHLGDLHSWIGDKEVELIAGLSERVVNSGQMLIRLSEICAELDCLLSFAQAATLYAWCRPELNESKTLDIRGGRHPLQELNVDNFQPNDTLLTGGQGNGIPSSSNDHRSVEVLTGANGSGKSIYIQQVALIVFLAQIGSYVPAASASIGIVDAIFTRLHSFESVAKAQSSFMSDLGQVAHALQNCTSRSLILLDEFGKGTSSIDGAAIFAATLKHLVSLGSEAPRTLATTHFHEIFCEEILSPSLPLKLSYMQMLFSSKGGAPTTSLPATMGRTADNVLDSLTFLYRVVPGRCKRSYASHCARMVGMSDKLIQRAEYVTRLYERKELCLLEVEDLLVLAPPKDDDEDDDEDVEILTTPKMDLIQGRLRRLVEWDLQADIERVEQSTQRGDSDALEHLERQVRQKLSWVMGDEWKPDGESRGPSSAADDQ